MYFNFTEDQLLFRDAVAELLAAKCGPEVVRAAWDNAGTGRDPKLWAALAEMGIIGLTIPEAHGGLGMNDVDLTPLLTEAGRVALPAPVLETVAVAAPFIAESTSDAFAAEWLPQIADGSAIVTVQFEGQPFVTDAHIAQLLLVQKGNSMMAVPGESLRLTQQHSVDGARRIFSVDWDEADAQVVATNAEAAIAKAFNRAAVAASAELIGLSEQMIAMTVAYVVDRKQFGVPIGSFQAVKHHLADAELKVSFARPLVWNAAYAIANGSDSVDRDVSMAKCFASDAGTFVARKALQTHGAIGYTTEHDLHFWMKRTWALAGSFGDAGWHRRRVAHLLLDS
jgi:alkylation response protein AidB-like acyl-CoA dehydrogenase